MYSARKNLGLRFIIGTVLGSFVFFVFLAAKILNASILNTAIMGFLIWLVFPLLASFVSSVSLRQPFLLLSRSNETDTDDFPSVPLRKMFLVTAGFAAVYSIARVVPNQYETANSLFTTSCGAIVIFVGLFALVAGPAFAALSTLRWETRALILIANTVCFGTIVPLTFELGAQYYAGFVLGVAYFQLMLFVSILPARLLGYRLRLVLPDSPTTELPDRFRPPNRDSGLPST